ncbi:hypothetical protein ACQ4PT_064380 [Festuca glaucescens]
MADRTRLLDPDSEPEQPDPAAARAAIVPYLEEIDSYMRSLEELRRLRDYMLPVTVTQGAITTTKRAKVVDWLVEVADDLKLMPDTLHLAVSYVDRFLSVGAIIPSELQLLGVTALLVAAKFENDMHKVEEYSDITDNTYTKQQRAKAKTLEFMCNYLVELSLLDYDCTMFKPSVVAAACLFVARFTISPKNRPWNWTLQRKTGYKVSDLDCCILTIHELQLIGRYPGLEEEAIKVKYSHSEVGGETSVSARPSILSLSFPAAHVPSTARGPLQSSPLFPLLRRALSSSGAAAEATSTCTGSALSAAASQDPAQAIYAGHGCRGFTVRARLPTNSFTILPNSSSQRQIGERVQGHGLHVAHEGEHGADRDGQHRVLLTFYSMLRRWPGRGSWLAAASRADQCALKWPWRRGSSASAPARRLHQGASCCSFGIDGSGTARAPVPGTEAAAESACTLRLNPTPSAPANCSRASSPSAGCRRYPTVRHHRSSDMTHRV